MIECVRQIQVAYSVCDDPPRMLESSGTALTVYASRHHRGASQSAHLARRRTDHSYDVVVVVGDKNITGRIACDAIRCLEPGNAAGPVRGAGHWRCAYHGANQRIRQIEFPDRVIACIGDVGNAVLAGSKDPLRLPKARPWTSPIIAA